MGLGGNDSLSGGAGNDNFNTGFGTGNFGNDTIDGGTGSDSLVYSVGSTNPATVNLATGTATNAQGNTTLISIETVLGTAGADSFTGGDPSHGVDATGNTTTERFRGNYGNDTITGGAGNNFFATADYANNSATQAVTANLATGVVNDGRGGTDTLVNVDGLRGGSGNDVLTGGSLSRSPSGTLFESLRGNAGNDTLDGGPSSQGTIGVTDIADYAGNTSSQAINVNLATGTASDGTGGTDTLIRIDQVYGGAGNDTITGGAGGENLDGGRGNDILDGGAGTDQARYQQSTAGVIVNLSASSITVNSVTVAANTANDGMGGTDTLANFEGARGSDFNDHLRGSDSATDEFFNGDAGSDTIDGGGGTDYAVYSSVALTLGGINAVLANGSATVNDKQGGTDTLLNIEGLSGTNSNDTLTGGAGDQVFRGNGGNDLIDGGAGSDSVSYLGDPSGVTVNLATGQATDGWNGPGGLFTLGGTDTLTNIENVDGSNFNDTITGNSGDNILRGRGGNDTIDGGAGADVARFSGNATQYTITQNGNNYTVVGPDGTDTLIGVERLQFGDRQLGRDYNGDGKSDILWRNDSGLIAIWQMNGSTLVDGAVVSTVPTDWKIQDGAGDYNGDGKSDFLWRNDNGQVAIWQMNGSTLVDGSLVSVPIPSDWKIQDGAGDYNGDGKSDILWRNDAGLVAIWQMNGANLVDGAVVATVPTDWKIQEGSGDYNGDGKSDLLWRNDNGQVAIWQMNGANLVDGSLVSVPIPADWKIQDGAGDYNGDGKSDILWRNDAGLVAIWQMNGANLVDGAGDYNGDGKSDLLWRNDNGQVAIWQMNGSTLVDGSLASVPVPTDWNIQG